MKQSKYDVIALLVICALSTACMITVFMGAISLFNKAYAETYWIPATEKYYKYDTTPTRITKVYKYVMTTDIETVRDTWVKLNGIYAKYTTINGGIKYVEEVIITQPVPIEPVCAAVKCLDDFGVTYDINKLKEVLACPKVTIYKGQWVEYDGVQSINGVPTCR